MTLAGPRRVLSKQPLAVCTEGSPVVQVGQNGRGSRAKPTGGGGQEGLHPRRSESRGGAGEQVTWWGSQPSNMAEGGAGSTPWVGCIQRQGWAPGGSELGALQRQRLGQEGADCWEGTRSQSAQRLPGMETCRDPAAAGVSQLSMHCGGHLQDLARLPVHGTL